MTFSIALDAMGGDRAPTVVVGGADLARERHPDLRFVFYGNEASGRPFAVNDPFWKILVGWRINQSHAAGNRRHIVIWVMPYYIDLVIPLPIAHTIAPGISNAESFRILIQI